MSFLTKFLGKIPLRVVLVVPFVMQITAVVGLVGYLSFRNGQQAINDVAAQLRRELSSKIEVQLKHNIEIPPVIAQLNAEAVARGEIDIPTAKGEWHFWQQAKWFPFISYIYCGSQKGGEILGIARHPEELQKLDQIQSSQQLDFLLNGQRQFVQITPFKDGQSLDWLIAVVVPESDFMEQINANNRTTIGSLVFSVIKFSYLT